MKITHLYHSGFLVELSQAVLLFDWYMSELPVLNPSKTLYVFVSHGHPDHYSEKIWTLANACKEVHYILHKDVCKNPPHAVHFVRAHETYEIGGLQVQTLLSTDEGVAYLVRTEDRIIYHAGDLNLWHWDGEPEKDNKWQAGTYKAEIDRLKGLSIDAAFLTLDPRQQHYATLGMAYFLQQTDTKLAIPMHYWGKKEKAAVYLDYPDLKPFADKICFDDVITL